MKEYSAEKAPRAIGPYSHAVRAGKLVFLSGQIGLDPETGELAGADIVSQAEQACRNVRAVLDAAGAVPLKTTCFLKDMGDFSAFNGVYARYFDRRDEGLPLPARSCVEAAGLPRGALCEIEAIGEVTENGKN